MRTSSRTARGVATLVAVGLAVPALQATTAVSPASIAALTEQAEVVVHGEVTALDSALEARGIFTTVTVDVSEVLAGRLGAPTATLRLYGGTVGDVRTLVIGAPALAVGEEIVAFLRGDGSGSYGFVGLAEGKFEVVRQDDGAEAEVRRDLSGLHYLVREGWPRFPTTLAELRAAIRGAGR